MLGTAILSIGCRKKEIAAPSTPPAPAKPVAVETAIETPPPPPPAPPGAGDAPSAPPVATVAPPGTGYQVDEKLFPILDRYYNEKLRQAMSWQDLVAGKYIPSIPMGPDGKPLDWNTTMQRLGKAAAARAGH